MKKILQVSPAIYPALEIGGPIFTELRFRESIYQSCELTILTTDLGSNEKNFLSTKKIINETNYESCSKIVVHKIFGKPNISFSLSQAFWLIFNIRKYDTVINQGVWNFPFLLSLILTFFFDKKLLIFTHGTVTFDTIDLKNRFFKSQILKLYNFFLKNKDVIITNTRTEKQDVDKLIFSNASSVIIPNMVNIDDCSKHKIVNKSRLKTELYRIGYYGRVTPKKRLDLTFNLLSDLRDQGFMCHLTIVGPIERSYYKSLQSLSQNLKIEELITWKGMYSHNDGMKFLATLDAFILLSLNENFGVAPIEALACGTSIIISDRVGIKEYVKDFPNVLTLSYQKLQEYDPEVVHEVINFIINIRSRESVDVRCELNKLFSIESIAHLYKDLIA